MANKPELEIFADDVLCAHGATSGQIDEDLLFYLRARGIPEDEAKTLLVLGLPCPKPLKSMAKMT